MSPQTYSIRNAVCVCVHVCGCGGGEKGHGRSLAMAEMDGSVGWRIGINTAVYHHRDYQNNEQINTFLQMFIEL